MQRTLDMNFGEFTFHALGCIRPAALLEERTGLGCRDGSDVQRKDRVCYCGAPTLPPCAPGFPQGVGASRLRPSWPKLKALARAFSLGHGAVVEQRSQRPPDDRPQYVEPETRKVPGNDHRSQRARRIDRPPGHRPRDEHPYRQGEAHRYGGDRSGSPLVCGHRHYHEHKYEGDKNLHHKRLQVPHPLRRIGGRKLCLVPRTCSAEGPPGSKRCEHRSHQLRTYVMWGVLPRELASGGHPKGDSRVDVRSGDVTYGGNHDGKREPEGQRYGQRVVSGPSSGAREDRAHSNRRPAEYQYEGPYQLGYGRAEDVGGIYLAAVEPAASRLLLFLLVDRPPCAPADTLFQTGLFFRADPATSDAGSGVPGCRRPRIVRCVSYGVHPGFSRRTLRGSPA